MTTEQEALDLIPVRIEYRRMRWTKQAADLFVCGCVEVRPRDCYGPPWIINLNGRQIGREYNSAQDAMFAAPHLGQVKKLREAGE